MAGKRKAVRPVGAAALKPRFIGIELRLGPQSDFFQYKDGRGATGRYRVAKIDRAINDRVEFSCKVFVSGREREAPFAVHFKGLSPFEKGRYASSGAAFQARFRPNAQGGVYKYFVAVWDDKNQRIWTDDPEMIVW